MGQKETTKQNRKAGKQTMYQDLGGTRYSGAQRRYEVKRRSQETPGKAAPTGKLVATNVYIKTQERFPILRVNQSVNKSTNMP